MRTAYACDLHGHDWHRTTGSHPTDPLQTITYYVCLWCGLKETPTEARLPDFVAERRAPGGGPEMSDWPESFVCPGCHAVLSDFYQLGNRTFYVCHSMDCERSGLLQTRIWERRAQEEAPK